MTDFKAARQWIEQNRGRYKPDDADFEIYEDVAALLDLAERQERQLETAVAVLREIGDKEVGWALAWSRAHEALAAIEGKTP